MELQLKLLCILVSTDIFVRLELYNVGCQAIIFGRDLVLLSVGFNIRVSFLRILVSYRERWSFDLVRGVVCLVDVPGISERCFSLTILIVYLRLLGGVVHC